MIICGHCGNKHSTVQEVRECAGLTVAVSQKASEEQPPPPVRDVEITDGMWTVPTNLQFIGGKEFPAVYKVQVAHHGSGTLYAKLLTDVDCDGRLIWEYVGRSVFPLLKREGERLTVEQAAEFGALYGRCVRCGRVLTAETSIERMLGPVCYERLMSGR